MPVKKKVVKNPKVSRTRNNQTLTESAFWGFIRSTLRNASRWWKPIAQCKLNSRRAYKGINKLQKWEYLCNHCGGHFMEKEVQIDHIIDAGTLTCANDVAGFIERLFCEEGGFQTLCKPCHQIKTNSVREEKKLKK
jgi:hypothetical protein